MSGKISRAWAMPSPNTFSIKPISELLDRWLEGKIAVVDPFARNSKRASLGFSNDLSPEADTLYHMDAAEFLESLHNKLRAEVILLDPPYSPRQITECYSGVGRKTTTQDTQSSFYRKIKDAADRLAVRGTCVICCGWNSGGMGIGRNYKLEEILLVCHGGAHNDTIVTVEVKL